MTTLTPLNGIDGRVLAPGDPGYDEARTVWNAMVDRRPALVVRAASTDDVAAAIRYARDHGLEIGVRGGGHGIVGHAVPDGGLMIDLRALDRVLVDPRRRLARIGGGALLGALDRATQPYGLATTAGNVSHTGVGGLTLGGGMGWLARQLGLAADNVVACTVVTATGEVLRVRADRHPDLSWALRGGGGNFGVVTEFVFALYGVGRQALSVELDFPLERAAAALRGWRDLAPTAPRAATLTATVADGVATLGYVWVGRPEQGRGLLPAFRALGRPAAERVEELSYLELQTREDTAEGHDLRRYWKGHYLGGLPDDAVDALLLRGTATGEGAMLPTVSLQQYGGAIADVPDDATAFGQRGTAFELVASTGWTDPAEDAARMAAARAAGAAMAPFASGAYVNALADEGQDGVRRAYPPAKLARLTAVKDAYDPDNVFHLNQNIRPSAAT